MRLPAVSRREFMATGGALVAAAYLPSWSEALQAAPTDAARVEAAETALARATTLGASYADTRVNRYRRESIATREQQVQNVQRSASHGMGLRVLVNRHLPWSSDRCGLRRHGALHRVARAGQRRG